MAADQKVIATRESDVAFLTLNAPDRLNAFSNAMLVTLTQALGDATASSGARVAALTGAGRGFCSGATVTGDDLGKTDPGDLINRYYYPLAIALAESPVPIITAVNGVAAGPPIVLGMIRRHIRAALDTEYSAMLAAERDNQLEAGFTRDHAEGIAALGEKRAPVFTGA